jgi:hypothetical protein
MKIDDDKHGRWKLPCRNLSTRQDISDYILIASLSNIRLQDTDPTCPTSPIEPPV